MSTKLSALALVSGLLFAAPAARAQAADAPPAKAASTSREVLVGFRGIGEIWQDEAIVQGYRSSRFAGAGMGGFGITRWLMVEAELGYMRQPSDSGRQVTYKNTAYEVAPGFLELIPVTLGLSLNKELDRAEVFGGVGGALVVFTEDTSEGTVSGVKPGLDMRLGTRIHTSFMEPRIRPGMGSASNKGVDVELMLGRRQHHAFGMGSGFDFGAWRVSAGLVARL